MIGIQGVRSVAGARPNPLWCRQNRFLRPQSFSFLPRRFRRRRGGQDQPNSHFTRAEPRPLGCQVSESGDKRSKGHRADPDATDPRLFSAEQPGRRGGRPFGEPDLGGIPPEVLTRSPSRRSTAPPEAEATARASSPKGPPRTSLNTQIPAKKDGREKGGGKPPRPHRHP